MNLIKERIAALRKLMHKHKIDAYLVPSTDEHQNEYTPEHKKRREWISGFTGSAGDVIVAAQNSYLWTDSRYFLQAESELAESGIMLLRAGIIDYPDIYDWLMSILTPGQSIGVDPALLTYDDAVSAIKRLSVKKIKLRFIKTNLIDSLWTKKEKKFPQLIEIHPLQFCGVDYSSKLKKIREKMSEAECTSHIISSLDSICWLFNLRAQDIPYNPLLISYAVITDTDAFLFTDPAKVSDEVKRYAKDTITLLPYSEFIPFCKKLAQKKQKIWVDHKRTSYLVVSALGHKSEIYLNESPVYYYKALKNKTEIASLSNSMIKDGIAMVRFLSWLDKSAHAGRISEESAAFKLGELRAENDGYAGPSFHTISAFKAHGAIVHYSFTQQSSIPIEGDGLFLIDSGAHYFGGTTDITRTIAIGSPTEEQKIRYTFVLKGHIALATAHFPKGTKGVQLDTLARKPLWDWGLDYGHGTGHGVGFYLNVHEGPQSISSSKLSSPGLEPGMLITDEPGYYKKGEYGIRIENILLVLASYRFPEAETPFYSFRTLTLCPYDKRLIVTSLLLPDEIAFINAYHKKNRELLSVHLKDKDDQNWLFSATEPLDSEKSVSLDSISDFF